MTPNEHDRETPVEPVPAEILKAAASKRPPATAVPPPPRRPSGQHPAVVGMRKKLASLLEAQATAHDELDAKIDETTARLRTPLPPAIPVEEDPGEETTPTSH